jgi:hypothetical protein
MSADAPHGPLLSRRKPLVRVRLSRCHVPDNPGHCTARQLCLPGSALPPRAGFRNLGLRGLSARSAPSGYTAGGLAVARGDQFLLELQPFIGCHDGLFARRRQIFYREICACFRRHRCLSPRVHQR